MRLGKVKTRFFPVMLAVSVLLCMISIAVYHTGAMSFVFDAVGLVTVPFEKAADGIDSLISSISARFSDVDELRRENELLREENARLVAENRESLAVTEEYNKLREFLGLKNERSELSFVDAKIVARDVGHIRTFSLDKGSFHGISENMPVITSDGLLGLITEAGTHSSRGISIINHNTSVGVYLERTMTSAVLTGSFDHYGRGLCKIINLPTDADVVVGDTVYTSGYGGMYPKDIVVGTVVSVEHEPSNYTLSAVVQPAADMNLSDFVMVITESISVYE